MSDIYMKNFNKRVRRINKKHRKMSHGIVHSINHDGLIVARARRRGPRLPWKGIAFAIVAFFGFKVFLLIQLGQATYDDRIELLQAGTIIEQAGAYVMSADPLTMFIANQVEALMR